MIVTLVEKRGQWSNGTEFLERRPRYSDKGWVIRSMQRYTGLAARFWDKKILLYAKYIFLLLNPDLILFLKPFFHIHF